MLGAVLSVDAGAGRAAAAGGAATAPTSACALERLPAPVLASLRWPGRPELPGGNAGVELHDPAPARRVRAVRRRAAGRRAGRPRAATPFEVWVNGAEQPRGLGALAKTLSMDLRANDAAWLQLKLDALATVAEERAFEMPFPPHGEPRLFPGVVAATAAVIRWRCEQLGALPQRRRRRRR